MTSAADRSSAAGGRPVALLVGRADGLGAAQAPQAAQPPATSPERVLLTAGRSTVLITDFDITRIAVTNPAIADAVVVKPREVLVDGKGAGTVSLIVWGASERKHYDVVVDPGVTNAAAELPAAVPRRGHQRRASPTRRSSCRARSRATT